MLGIVRLRRYRSLFLFVLITLIVFFHFYSFGDTNSAFSVDRLREYTVTVSKPNLQHEQSIVDVSVEAPILPPPIPIIEKPPPRTEIPTKVDELKPSGLVDTPEPKPTDTAVATPKPKPADAPKISAEPSYQDNGLTIVSGVQALDNVPPEHWVKIPEHFPVPKDEIIPLPKKYKELPQIQASFAKELGSKREVRLERQKSVKDAMIHTWKGYRRYAWLHDELSPVTKYFRDPFAGWGATLVDALDTLWIMGLEEEFLEAVEAVGKIDFTTTHMQAIPVFETVIRYLGGLIGAYDVSGEKHQILIDKAIELADMLYSVFDTPNRMPILHWGWRPRQAARASRGDLRAVAAELGSLTVEFTRLAQITGNNSYFDAVQRITDALEEFQPKTGLPGLWPITIDTSGCKVIQVSIGQNSTHSPIPLPPNSVFADNIVEDAPGAELGAAFKVVPVHGHGKRQESEEAIDRLAAAQGGHIALENELKKKENLGIQSKASIHPGLTAEAQSAKIQHEREEELQDGRSSAVGQQLAIAVGATSTTVQAAITSPSCVPQGLSKPAFQRDQKYTLGGMADSLYEYLIKEYILLGGALDQYKNMYVLSIEQAKKYLFFRPLAEGDPDVLISGNANLNHAGITFDTDSGHLSCFTGGMLALGARALGREADLEIAAKLTDGCVWAYASFESGIMPESFRTAYCKDAAKCKFDATEYYEQLVPKYRRTDKPAADPYLRTKRAVIPDPERDERKLETPITNTVQEDYPTLEEIARQIIDDESLPTGFTSVMNRKYILRPEAIESVFIMYRLTADSAWQDKGWKMWQSVSKATRTEFGFSAINDVTRGPSDPKFLQLDEMESFWLAETLKYYYLLFSEPDLISLDDFVLNTEAHPLRRPHPSFFVMIGVWWQYRV